MAQAAAKLSVSDKKTHQPLISINGWRRIAQVCVIGFLFILPLMGWLRLDTTGLGGRFDITLLKLQFFGKSIWLNDFFIVNLVFLWLIALLTFFSVVLGRVFCGWICPQTPFSELVVNNSKGKVFPKLLVSLGIGLYFSVNSLLYFVDVRYLLSGFTAPTKHPVVFCSFWVITAIGFVDMFVYRHTFCNGFCPYGWLQSIFQGENAIVVRFDEKRESECLKCRQCVKVCYMGIDIRNGPLQMECQKCGKCIDSCRDVVRKTGIKKFIRFAVENPKGESSHLFSFRSFSLAIVLLALTGLIFFMVNGKQIFHLVVNRNSNYTSTSKSKNIINAYRLEIDSYSEVNSNIVIAVSGINGVRLLRKNTSVKVKAGDRKILRVFISAPKENLSKGVNPLHFTIRDLKDPDVTITEKNSFIY